MKKSETVENVLILVSVVLLFPIWLATSGQLQVSETWLRVLDMLKYPVVIVMSVIFIRRLRKVLRALRENRNRQGPL